MRKDLILIAALTGLTVCNAPADPGGNSGTIPEADRAPIHDSPVKDTGQPSDLNAARASISGEVTSSSDREIGAAQEFRGETPGTLGARGTIGQDATGFTGQERIGTLPPGRLGPRKTNAFDKEFDRANEEIKERQRSGDFLLFDSVGAGGPASGEIGRAGQLDPGSKLNTSVNSSLHVSAPEALGPNAPGIGKATDPNVTPPPDNSAVKRGAPAGAVIQPNNSGEDTQMSVRLRTQLLNATVPGGTSKLTPRQLQHVQVRASTSGEVTLSGTVAASEDKGEVESIVKRMPGVSSVNNQLTIKGADGKTDNPPEPAK